MTYVKTPKGIMYLINQSGNLMYCWDDQTGKNYIFLLSEVTFIQEKIKTEIDYG